MARVLWLSDGGCTTGFGRVTHSIGERLVRDYGHEIHVLAVNHRGDDYPSLLDPTQKTPLRLYMPTQLDPRDVYGKSRFLEMLGKIEPDVVVIVNDPQVILGFLFENKRWDPNNMLREYRPILTYVPCDGTGLPQTWTALIPKVSRMLAMSDWGEKQYPGSIRVWHGVDSDRFWPVSDKRPAVTTTGLTIRTKRDAKRAYGFDPEGFLVGRVDTNSSRKDWAATWKALVPFMRRHADVAVHMHGNSKPHPDGVDMENLLHREPDIAQDRFRFPGMHSTFAGWAEQDMNVLYNAFDVFISTSHGEGFGLTLAEAAAVGIPIIAQNVSAIPEVVGPGGILIEPAGLVTVMTGEDQWLPDIPAFTDALERLYASRRMRRDLGQAGHEHAVANLSWDHATAAFDHHISELAVATSNVLPEANDATPQLPSFAAAQ